MPKSITINRTWRFSESIGGRLSVDGVFVCNTLERPWRWNEKNVSCIPGGVYSCFWRPDRNRLQLRGVPGRTAIQVHIGNDTSASQGCILVGRTIQANYVGSSAAALDDLKQALFPGQVGPAYTNDAISLTIGGVIMDSFFDNLDAVPSDTSFA